MSRPFLPNKKYGLHFSGLRSRRIKKWCALQATPRALPIKRQTEVWATYPTSFQSVSGCRACPVTRITAHSTFYRFAVTAPSSPAVQSLCCLSKGSIPNQQNQTLNQRDRSHPRDGKH
jgi:hypothetical protein